MLLTLSKDTLLNTEAYNFYITAVTIMHLEYVQFKNLQTNTVQFI